MRRKVIMTTRAVICAVVFQNGADASIVTHAQTKTALPTKGDIYRYSKTTYLLLVIWGKRESERTKKNIVQYWDQKKI
jgi:hypothetical protein